MPLTEEMLRHLESWKMIPEKEHREHNMWDTKMPATPELVVKHTDFNGQTTAYKNSRPYMFIGDAGIYSPPLSKKRFFAVYLSEYDKYDWSSDYEKLDEIIRREISGEKHEEYTTQELISALSRDEGLTYSY